MKKIQLFFLFILLTSDIFAQLPNTDIWLLDIKAEKDSILFTNPVNITNRLGYDNQPAFSPDGKYILYTSIRDEKQSDIFRYDLKTKTTSQFTNTATSEYSPTFMPDGKNISVVMVEADSAQRLWKFPIKGGAPELIMKGIDSIGYHCWLDETHVALFLITKPFQLVFTDIKTDKSEVIVNDTIGRTLKTIKSKQGYEFYFIYKKEILSINEKGNRKEFLAYLETEDFCPYNHDEVFFASNDRIYVAMLFPKMAEFESGKSSRLITDLSKYGITKITRIAISPDKKHIAIVSESK